MEALQGNIGAQKTGAVWSACDAMLTKLPKGNRACMRRELFTWVGDCNETMQEFQNLVDLGVADTSCCLKGEDLDSAAWDEFCENLGTGDQYSAIEMPICKSCLALIKCSRGVFGLVLKALECAGDASSSVELEFKQSKDVQDEEEKIALAKRRDSIWQWISNIHDMASVAGAGVTDLGFLLYPPLDLQCGYGDEDKDSDGHGKKLTWDQTQIGKIALRQRDCLAMIVNCVTDAIPPGEDQGRIEMSDEVMEMASKIQCAVDSRKCQIESEISNALKIRAG